MGGKGGGGQQYYQQPPDTSGYGTPEEAKITLAKEAPLDLSGRQAAINVKRAAAEATAPTPIPKPPASGNPGAGDTVADAILKPPAYWGTPGTLTAAPVNRSRIITTQS
jgi:hypothetical protein